MAFFNEEKRKRIQHEIWVISTFFFTFLFSISPSECSSSSSSLLSSTSRRFPCERKREERWRKKKTLQTRECWKSLAWWWQWEKNVHTINLNLIQIAFCHHYKAKASLLLSPHTFIMKKGKIPGAKNTYIFTSNPPIKISSFYTRI